MFKKHLITTGIVLLSVAGFSQITTRDTLLASSSDDLLIDTSFDYDDLLKELDVFLDSLLMPRSYFLVTASVGNGYFNYTQKNNSRAVEIIKKNIYSPTIGYFDKSGPGIALSGNIINDQQQLNLYQFSISPSFDLIKNRNWIAGISYTRYFTKDSLSFYISPLQNEFNAYFLWRKSWLQPGITASYGWGSHSEYEKREKYIRLLRLRHPGYVFSTTTKETISDFSLTASIRHSFYWMHVLGEKDFIKFTPQIAFSSGTRQFGFNRTTSYPATLRAGSYLFNRGDLSIDKELKFQPLSFALYLRPEYNIGKLFVQPQFVLDYYFPAKDLAALFSINTGIVF